MYLRRIGGFHISGVNILFPGALLYLIDFVLVTTFSYISYQFTVKHVIKAYKNASQWLIIYEILRSITLSNFWPLLEQLSSSVFNTNFNFTLQISVVYLYFIN